MLVENVISILRHVFKKRDRFAFLLSLYGAVAYTITTLTPTLLDPVLHNPIYGTRTYPIGTWVSLVSGLVFIFLYRSNLLEKDILKIANPPITRAVFSFLAMLIPPLSMLWNFLPELPHMWIFNYSFLYAAIIGFASFLHNYDPGYPYAADEGIDPRARIEFIRMIYNSYYVAIALIVTVGVGSIALTNNAPRYFQGENEQIMLDMAIKVNLVSMLLGLFWGLACQVFASMYKAQQKLLEIKNEERTLQRSRRIQEQGD